MTNSTCVNDIKFSCAAGLFAIGSLGLAAPATAEISTFASFSAIGSNSNVRWQKSGTNGGSIYTIATPASNVPGATAVNFDFLQPALQAFGPLRANFTLAGTATASPATVVGGFIFQPILTGSFSFVYSGSTPLVLNGTTYFTGANLLSAQFTTGSIAGQKNGTSGALSSSTAAAGTITYTSDFLNFSSSTAQDLLFGLSSITGGLKQTSVMASLTTFKANTSGYFSADHGPTVTAVPEPAVWGLLFVGFSLIGSAMRRRPRFAAS